MKNTSIIIIWALAAILFHSCSSSRMSESSKAINFSVQGGLNVGGITENTDMSLVPEAKAPEEATVDAFSGATHTAYNLGAHLNIPIAKNQIETGVDYMYNYQVFNYIDAGNFYIGVRRFEVSQLMFPISYNLVLFRNLLPQADIQLKLGFLAQRNFVSVSETGILPTYSVQPWSKGLTLGFSAFPFQFRNGDKLGVYFDIYRGSQIYEDFYNQKQFEMPGTSFVKMGLKYQF